MKKSLLLTLLAAPLILASCGTSGAKESTPNPTDTSNVGGESANPGDTQNPGEQGESQQQPEQSSNPPEITRAEKVTALFAKMATGASSTFVDPTMATTEYYGENLGYLNIFTAAYLNAGAYNGGVVIIPNYGAYKYEYDVDADNITYAQIYSPNTTLKTSDFTYTTKDLGLAAANLKFDESARTHTFSTTDETFCSIIAALDGYGSDTSNYPTKKVSFNISDDGETINNLKLTMSGATDKTNYPDVAEENLKIEKVGTTVNLEVEVFSTNTTPTAATSWSTVETDVFAQFYNGFALPFPTGATYAVRESINEKNEFVYYDLKCGDKTASYGAQLVAAGFTLTDASKGRYEKTLSAPDANPEIRQYVEVSFLATAGTNYSELLPYGMFGFSSSIYRVRNSQPGTGPTGGVYDDIASLKTYQDPNLEILPGIDFGDTPVDIEFIDATAEAAAQYPSCDQLFYGAIQVFFESFDDLEEAYYAIAQYLLDVGYEYDQYYEDFFIEEGTDATGAMEYIIDITLDYGIDEDTGYYYLIIIIDHYGN